MLSRRVKFHVFHVKTFGSVRLLNGAQRKGIEPDAHCCRGTEDNNLLIRPVEYFTCQKQQVSDPILFLTDVILYIAYML